MFSKRSAAARVVIAVGVGLVSLVGLGAIATIVAAQRAESPVPLGLQNGQLALCPPTPNCVSSQSSDPQHAIAPLPYDGRTAEARAALRSLIASYPRTSILRDEADYLHVMFRSATFGFPDDVEFYFDAAAKQIHVRSASRLGRGDLGVNRARIEMIRTDFAARQ